MYSFSTMWRSVFLMLKSDEEAMNRAAEEEKDRRLKKSIRIHFLKQMSAKQFLDDFALFKDAILCDNNGYPCLIF